MTHVNGEILKTLETNNRNVTFSMEYVDGDYGIFATTYDERIDFIAYNPDEIYVGKMLQFMVDAYNMGYIDGKNSALMFMRT